MKRSDTSRSYKSRSKYIVHQHPREWRRRLRQAARGFVSLWKVSVQPVNGKFIWSRV